MRKSALPGVFLVAFVAALLVAGCGASPKNTRFPAQPEGCAVQVFENPPPMPTDNIGTVRERCPTDVPRDACIRSLEDQACRLGANVIWGVADAPRINGDKNEWDGRAAHTK